MLDEGLGLRRLKPRQRASAIGPEGYVLSIASSLLVAQLCCLRWTSIPGQDYTLRSRMRSQGAVMRYSASHACGDRPSARRPTAGRVMRLRCRGCRTAASRTRSGMAARSASQLLIVFVLIDFVAALVAGGVTILKARTATRVEIAASMELAELLVSEAADLMQQEVPAEHSVICPRSCARCAMCASA